MTEKASCVTLSWPLLMTSVLLLLSPSVDAGALPLDSSNVDSVIASNELVLINFYADWCRFSNLLAPVWDEFADKLASQLASEKSNNKVVVAKVDCDKEGDLGTRFHITKYPTIKYVIGGQVAKREYRGQRSVEAFINFVKEQISDPVESVDDLAKINNLDEARRHVIGYFEKKESNEYEYFKRVARALKEDCSFHAGFGENVAQMHPPGQSIVAFRPNKATSVENDETFMGNILNYDELKAWVTEKCTPLVREITFENAEELTEEGLPFLILFYDPDDRSSIKRFSEAVHRELLDDKQKVNFLTADGVKFAHPLHHLGKSKRDLPLIAIDSFRHMYLFDSYQNMDKPNMLKQFLRDLYSGKLHREFHYGPDKTSSDAAPRVESGGTKSPPPSQFQHLGPSRNRYTLLHDEF